MGNRIIIFILLVDILFSQTNLTLKDCIKLALENNYELKASRLNIESEEMNYKIIKKAEGWRTDLTLEYNANNIQDYRKGSIIALEQVLPTGGKIYLSGNILQKRLEPYFYGKPLDNSLSFGLYFSQEIFTPNLQNLKEKKAKIRYESAKLSAEEKERSIIFLVTSAFFQIISLQEKYKVSKKSLESAKKLYLLSKEKYEKGISKDIEIIEAELQYSEKEIENQKLNLEIYKAKSDFKNILGIDFDFNLIFNQSSKPQQVDKDEIIRLSPKIKLKEMQLLLDDIEIEEAGTGFDFKVQLSGEYGKSYKGSDFKGKFEDDWKVGIKVMIPLWDSKITRDKIEVAKIKKENDKILLENEMKSLKIELEKELNNLNLQEKYIELNRKVKENALKDLELKNEKFQFGYAKVVDVIRSQDNYIQAEYELINSIIEYEISKARLYLITGIKEYGP